MEYCCERFKKWFDEKVITKDISGYWIWLQRDVDHDGDWEIINFCLNCGKKLSK